MELRDHPSSRDLYSSFHLRFVPRPSWTRWDNYRAVVPRHSRVRTVDVGFVEAGFGDPRLKIVADRNRRHAAKKPEGASVRADPIGERLCPGGFRERIGVAPKTATNSSASITSPVVPLVT